MDENINTSSAFEAFDPSIRDEVKDITLAEVNGDISGEEAKERISSLQKKVEGEVHGNYEQHSDNDLKYLTTTTEQELGEIERRQQDYRMYMDEKGKTEEHSMPYTFKEKQDQHREDSKRSQELKKKLELISKQQWLREFGRMQQVEKAKETAQRNMHRQAAEHAEYIANNPQWLKK